jgi:type II secretory pathway component PulF
MKNFKCSTITTGSKKVNEISSANDLKEVKIALKEKNLRPIELKETKI